MKTINHNRCRHECRPIIDDEACGGKARMPKLTLENRKRIPLW